jgi:hypothetical protein
MEKNSLVSAQAKEEEEEEEEEESCALECERELVPKAGAGSVCKQVVSWCR